MYLVSVATETIVPILSQSASSVSSLASQCCCQRGDGRDEEILAAFHGHQRFVDWKWCTFFVIVVLEETDGVLLILNWRLARDCWLRRWQLSHESVETGGVGASGAWERAWDESSLAHCF